MGRLTIDAAALALLRSLAPQPKRAVRAAIDLLQEDPRARGLDWKRLETAGTSEPLYRLRVGDYRVVYHIGEATTRVIRIFHRREGYRWLQRLGY